ncbi:MAG: InlB B-repeat-containing protein [Clostridiales Family XIII bacterium]|jgi:uncharacterized repeat protein (TIGR02543 family)|nr:InlB B-repeat-containing protein [Clostridiales Family XIII bacterium]
MKKNYGIGMFTKRTLAFLLAALMVILMIPQMAMAADTEGSDPLPESDLSEEEISSEDSVTDDTVEVVDEDPSDVEDLAVDELSGEDLTESEDLVVEAPRGADPVGGELFDAAEVLGGAEDEVQPLESYFGSFVFKINSGSDQKFLIPLTGQLGGGIYGIEFDWLIDWGDGVTESWGGVSSASGFDNANGIYSYIPHDYADANKDYVITITPNSWPVEKWLAAFGFSASTELSNANSPENRPKVLEVMSPILPAMTRTAAQINGSAPPPNCEWQDTFNSCINVKMGEDFTFDQTAWAPVTAAGDYFADHMFAHCNGVGNRFEMSDIFNLPENITTVGDNFAANMFDNCNRDTFTMGRDFNLPQGITTIGWNFAADMFVSCGGNAFTMNDIFNLPPGITAATGSNFACEMFFSCVGDAFNMNSVFNLPQGITGAVGDNFAGRMFSNCLGANFTMNDIFNFPPGITATGIDFAANMFSHLTANNIFTMSPVFNIPQGITTVGTGFLDRTFEFPGRSFQINDVFKFPALAQDQVDKTDVFRYTLAGFPSGGLLQTRDIKEIINGNPAPSGQRLTFSGMNEAHNAVVYSSQAAFFEDWYINPLNWGCGDYFLAFTNTAISPSPILAGDIAVYEITLSSTDRAFTADDKLKIKESLNGDWYSDSALTTLVGTGSTYPENPTTYIPLDAAGDANDSLTLYFVYTAQTTDSGKDIHSVAEVGTEAVTSTTPGPYTKLTSAADKTVFVKKASTEEFKITVNSGSDHSFILPTSGYLGSTLGSYGYGDHVYNESNGESDVIFNTNNTYDWLVDWGDGTVQHVTGSAALMSGIPHDYGAVNPGTPYTITISPADSEEAWLGAFGFTHAGAPIYVSNKQKLTGVLSAITPQMTRTSDQISGIALPPDYEWANTFNQCRNIEMGTDFTFDQSAWAGITTVGDCFAANMFRGCDGIDFTMNDVFNLPEDLVSVGDYFVENMFYGCQSFSPGNSFNMSDVFNLPENITEVGLGFAHGLFSTGYNAVFTMNSVFNIPQGITTVEAGFARTMFYGCLAGVNFEINDVFQFPKLDSGEVNKPDVFDQVFSSQGALTAKQTRTVSSIINGNETPEYARYTFSRSYGQVANSLRRFTDWEIHSYNWGCGDLVLSIVKDDFSIAPIRAGSDAVYKITLTNLGGINHVGYERPVVNADQVRIVESLSGDWYSDSALTNKVATGSTYPESPSYITLSTNGVSGDSLTLYFVYTAQPADVGTNINNHIEVRGTSSNLLIDEADNNAYAVGTSDLSGFKITANSGADHSFLLPTSGYLGDNASELYHLNDAANLPSNAYDWWINWGDGSPIERQTDSTIRSLGSGIPHDYPASNTDYPITIYPAGTGEAWLGAFGFGWNNYTDANAQANRNKVTGVLSPILPQMTRTPAQIAGTALPPKFEWAFTFNQCRSLTMGSLFNFDPAAWNTIETAGIGFAEYLFYDCSGDAFTMNSVFNLPQGITAVGDDFANAMFSACPGSSFNMNAVFNLPPNIVTVGSSFAGIIFAYDSGNAFTMNSVFNMPQGITAAGDDFALGMFQECSGDAFQMNSIFNLPPVIITVGGHFAESMFASCSGPVFNMNNVFNLPQGITAVGDSFANSMFDSCHGNAFNMNSIFNLPPDITTVGGAFAGRMFIFCHGDAFTMNSVFNLPQGITTITAVQFAHRIFERCYNSVFTMNSVFNIPQGITVVDEYFVDRMFFSAGGESFQINDVFRFPKLSQSEVDKFRAFRNAFSDLNEKTKLQTRSIQSIINGNPTPSVQRWTFSKQESGALDEAPVTSQADVFSDWEIRPYHWGCGNLVLTVRFVAGSGGSLSGTNSFPAEPNAVWSAAGITVPTPVAASHYVFTGWSPAIPAGTAVITADATYRATFGRDSHTVTYNGNGNTSGTAPATASQTHGTKVTVASRGTLARTDYTFTGWNTAANGSGTAYAAGSSFTISDNITLYAQWNNNGGGTPPPQPPEPPVTPDQPSIPQPPSTPQPPVTPQPSVVTPVTPVTPAVPVTPVTPDTPPTPALTGALTEQSVPEAAPSAPETVTVEDSRVAQSNFFGNGAWSLISLILSAVAIILSILLLAGALMKRRKSKTGLFGAMAIILGVLTLIAWLLLDDFTQPMVWANQWTLIVGILFVVHFVLFLIYKIRNVPDPFAKTE